MIIPDYATLRQEKVKCQKNCCRGGPSHGPYWYAYWRVAGRLRKRYLGRQLPEDLVGRLDGQADELLSRCPVIEPPPSPPPPPPATPAPGPGPGVMDACAVLGLRELPTRREPARKAYWNRSHTRKYQTDQTYRELLDDAWNVIQLWIPSA